jgi:hypothetical protein
VSATGMTAAVGCAALALAAAFDGALPVTEILGATAIWLVFRIGCQCGAAAAVIEQAVRQPVVGAR